MDEEKPTAVLLLSCQDQNGLVARIANFIFERKGNILDLSEHVDSQGKQFSIRVAWDISNFTIKESQINEAFVPLAKEYNANWKICFLAKKIKTAIFVSKTDHCLHEILWRYSQNEFNADISLIISNHYDLEPLARQYNIPFYVTPITKETKLDQEQKQVALLKKYNVETIILARYMQILSSGFIALYPSNIINIHHSFLPAFIGRNPYKQAFERGVKIIGASSHFATKDLDEGPIIEQDVVRISHRDSIKDLIRKGSDLERLVLVKAIRLHTQHRIIVSGKKTIIFD